MIFNSFKLLGEKQIMKLLMQRGNWHQLRGKPRILRSYRRTHPLESMLLCSGLKIFRIQLKNGSLRRMPASCFCLDVLSCIRMSILLLLREDQSNSRSINNWCLSVLNGVKIHTQTKTAPSSATSVSLFGRWAIFLFYILMNSFLFRYLKDMIFINSFYCIQSKLKTFSVSFSGSN